MFKDLDSLAKLEVIKQDWRQLALVQIGEKKVKFSVSPNYSIWINDGLSRVFDSFEAQSPKIVNEVRPFVTGEPNTTRNSLNTNRITDGIILLVNCGDNYRQTLFRP